MQDAAANASCTPTSRSCPYESYVELAERLLPLVPISGPTSARRSSTPAPRRSRTRSRSRAPPPAGPAVIAYEAAFHGRTLMAMSLTSKVHPYKAGFGPFAPEVYRVPFPNAVPLGPDAAADRAGRPAPRAARRASRPRPWPRSSSSRCRARAASCRPAPAYLHGLREICDEHGIVLIADEVQTGFGRTGTMFAMEQLGVEPDLVCVAKSIAGGCRSPACSAARRSWTRPATRPSAAPTSATRSACAAALAVLDVIDRRGPAAARATAIGDRMRAALEALQARTPAIGDVRGLGPMLGIEFVRDAATASPTPSSRRASSSEALAARPDPAQGRPARQRDPDAGAAGDH